MGLLTLSIYETDTPPEFRIQFNNWTESLLSSIQISSLQVTTIRSNQIIQTFHFTSLSTYSSNSTSYYQSTTTIPEPHEFNVKLSFKDMQYNYYEYSVEFIEDDTHHNHYHGHNHTTTGNNNNITSNTACIGTGLLPLATSSVTCDNHDHGHSHNNNVHTAVDHHKHIDNADAKYHRDNNFRSALCHVMADSFVSTLVVIALVIIGNVPHTNFLDPLIAIIGAFVILSWAISLIRDTTENLLDTCPDTELTRALRNQIEKDGSVIGDLHVWRLGPGHLGNFICLIYNNVYVCL